VGFDLRTEGGNGGEGDAIVEELVVDLVRNDVQVVLETHIRQRSQLFRRVDHAGGVGGVIEEDALGLVSDGRFQALRGELEVLRLPTGDEHGHAASHFGHLAVADPSGGGDDDLVPFVHQGLHDQIDAVLGTAADNDLTGLVFYAAVRFQTLADGLFQHQRTGSRRVFGVIIDNCLDSRQLDAIRRGEIRFTGGEAQDINAVRLHLLV